MQAKLNSTICRFLYTKYIERIQIGNRKRNLNYRMLRAHYDTKIILNNDYLSIVGSVVSRGLCSFYAKEYKAYAGRNPKTGESIPVKPKKHPFFKVGKELKERVDN